VSFVVVMRALGIPARVVTGYQGAESGFDGYFIVRQSHAHAWAEAWQNGRGWIRLDPTAAVSPERVTRSLNLVPTPGLVAGALRNVSPELMAQLRAGWEGLNNRWNQWVLNYSRVQQFDLLQSLGIRSPDWQSCGTATARIPGNASRCRCVTRWRHWACRRGRTTRRAGWPRWCASASATAATCWPTSSMRSTVRATAPRRAASPTRRGGTVSRSKPRACAGRPEISRQCRT
jgi:hypothetical protein